MTPLGETPPKPWWWTADWPYVASVGVTHNGVAVSAYNDKSALRLGAAQEEFRALKERIGVTPPCDTPEIVTSSVTPSASERKRAWREKNKVRSREINRASRAKGRGAQE